jgi:membrane protease YdiL (CAAX protease family)
MLATSCGHSAGAGPILARAERRACWNPEAVRAHRPTRHPGRLVAWLVFVLALTALNFAARLSGAETPDDLAYRYSSAVAAVIQFALMLGIALLIARGLPRRETFGLVAPRSWKRALGLVVLSLLAIYALSIVIVQALSLVTDENPTCEQGLAPTEWDGSRAGAFAAFFVAVVFLGPFVEEMIYRGLGFTLFAPFGGWTAILVTGVLFGAAHGLLVALPALVAFGIVVGWVRSRTGSIYPTVLVHAAFNGIALVAALLVSSPC